MGSTLDYFKLCWNQGKYKAEELKDKQKKILKKIKKEEKKNENDK